MIDKRVEKIVLVIVALIVYITFFVVSKLNHVFSFVFLILAGIIFLFVILRGSVDYSLMRPMIGIVILYEGLILIACFPNEVLECFQYHDLAYCLVSFSGYFVVEFGTCIVVPLAIFSVFFKGDLKMVKMGLMTLFYGPLPDVTEMEQNGRRVYLYQIEKTVMLLYEERKDKPQLLLQFDFDENLQYSLVWYSENIVLLQYYDVEERKLIREKSVELPTA